MKVNLTKVFAVSALSLALSACSTFGGKSNEAEIKTASANFAKQNGKVNIVFDSKGNWESVSATASGGIVGNSYNAQEQAATIATMRAKRNISEFLSTDLSSTKTLVVVSRTVEKANNTNTAQTGGAPVSLSSDESSSIDRDMGDQTKQITVDKNSSVVATRVREQISESSNAILKGVQVVQREVSPDGRFVQVKIEIVRKNVGVANKIRLEMQ